MFAAFIRRQLVLPFEVLPRAVRHRLFWLGIPLILHAWTLTQPFLFDDLALLLKAERYLRGEIPRPDLFRFAPSAEAWREMRSRGTYPWFSPDSRRIDFFRPLAEYSFVLDVRVFGRTPFGHRLISMGWFALALLIFHRLCTEASGSSIHAGLATFLLGLSQSLAQPVAFVANRSDLMVLCGLGVSALGWWRSAASSRSGWQAGALLGFAFALLCKEVAIAYAGVPLMHLGWLRIRRTPMVGAVARRNIAVGTLLMAAVYVAWYAYSRPWQFGLGAESGAGASLLSQAPLSLPLYLSVWTLGFPIVALLQAAPFWTILVAALGALGTIITGVFLPRCVRADRGAAYFMGWCACFLGMALLTLPETRALSIAAAGWAYILASLLFNPHHMAPPVPLQWRQWLLLTNGLLSVGCGIGTLIGAQHAEHRARAAMSTRLSALKPPLTDGDILIITQPDSPHEMICAGDRLEFLTDLHHLSVVFLTLPGEHVRFSRKDDHTLVIHAVDGRLLATPMHRLTLGPRWRPVVGDEIVLRDFTARISALHADGQPLEMELRFREPLADPRLRFLPDGLSQAARGLTDGYTPSLDR